MKLSPEKQKQLAITVLATVIAVVGTWYAGTQFVTSAKTSGDRSNKGLAAELVKRQKEIDQEKENREKAKTYQSLIVTMDAKMPKGNPETWLVRELSDIANRHKLQLSSTSVQPLKDFSDFRFKDPYQLLGFHLEFLGEFNQIGEFAQDIENSSPLMEIHDITITAGSEKATHVHKVSLTISEVTKL